MTVPRAKWTEYVKLLHKISARAGLEMSQYQARHPNASPKEILDFAHALATKYGEGTAALSSEMYDAMAAAQGAVVPAAIPAETATYGETSKAIKAVSEREIPQTVGRLVKQAGADTTLQNALRDGAEFAWIPSGDSCAFCLWLASMGWTRASKKAIRNGHATHIHANCDCTYAVRFDGTSEIAGYDYTVFEAKFRAAEGRTWTEKINSIRVEQYAADADRINAQKRIAYRAREDRKTQNQS